MRLAALERCQIMDTGPEPQFDDIAELAATLCKTPMVAITLIDEKRQWFKARIGIDVPETPRDIAFCDHTIRQTELFIVTDAREDARFANNPLVTGPPYIRFYAGAPLTDSDGFALGSLAVIDRVPRKMDAEQRRALRVLSHEVVAQIELRKNLRMLRQLLAERERVTEELRLSQRELERRVDERTGDLQREAGQRAREAALSQAIIDSLPGAFYLFDSEGRFLRWNRNFELITDYTHEEVARGRPLDFFGADREKASVKRHIDTAFSEGYMVVEACLRTKGGDLIPYYFTGERIELDGKACVSGLGIDITEIKRYEQQLERQANYDALTALVNRNVLKDRIRQAIAGAQRQGGMVTIGFMDLDNFKFINDSLGHNIGDKLLMSVAERLVGCLRSEDTVARYGGDEFAIVLIGPQDENSIRMPMERVLRTIDQPFYVDGHKLFVSCSIGLSFFPRDGGDVDTLLKNADVAMYRAKERGRNNFQFYTPALNKRVTERLSLESQLRQALENNEFVLHYQPTVDLRSGRIVGSEALLRWFPAGGGMVAPNTFIPLAEETGLIMPIGEWVLHTACAHNKMLQDAGLPPMRVAVNISARQFEASTIRAMVSSALSGSGMDASYLELELTESLLMAHPGEAIALLRELKEMGLRLAIDDFGTGYSSLSYLQRFPVDRLKIDQSFVRDIGANPNDGAVIARAVISLGHSLGKSVIAEGVSGTDQLAFLRENDCDEMQGYLFSAAVPIEEMRRMLGENRTLAVH